MGCTARIVWDDSLSSYDFGPTHPLAPVRCQLTMSLARELGVLDLPGVSTSASDIAGDVDLLRVHSPEYLAAVRRVSSDPSRPEPERGLGTDDNPVFAGMHEASARVAGATLAAVRAVHSGAAEHAVNIAGGLHHAMRENASGFCVYNDVAVGIAWLLDQGVERIGYVDVDVHHGDGVQAAFWNDPRVLTVSLHESPLSLFPGTGYAHEIGGPSALGCAVNVALPPGTGDDGWLRAFDAVVPAVLSAFEPQVLVTQQGCDSHFLDPLAHLTLTVDGQRAAYARLHGLAHELAGGSWVALGGGGYAIVDVVPRAWTHLLAEAAGKPLEAATAVPDAWREDVQLRLRRVGPGRMTDGRAPDPRPWSSGYDPADPLDRCVVATREAVFPAIGLDPGLAS